MRLGRANEPLAIPTSKRSDSEPAMEPANQNACWRTQHTSTLDNPSSFIIAAPERPISVASGFNCHGLGKSRVPLGLKMKAVS